MEQRNKQQQASAQCSPNDHMKPHLQFYHLLPSDTGILHVCNARAVISRTPKEIEGMRIVCRMGREILDAAHAAIRPGVTTDDIDRVVRCACAWHVPCLVIHRVVSFHRSADGAIWHAGA